MKVSAFKRQYVKKRMLDKIVVIGIVEYSASEIGGKKVFHYWQIPDDEELPEDDNVMIALKPVEKKDVDFRKSLKTKE